jgi:hypothetical protein
MPLRETPLLGLIAKNTYFSESERSRVQIRLEMFNAFNHPSLGSSNNSVTSGTFGQIQSYSGTARRLQLAAKFSF